MPAFPFNSTSPDNIRLNSLDPNLLEKIITKLESKSCYRLQQTCRRIDEFIRTSRKICIQLNGTYSIKFEKNSCFLHWYGSPKEIDTNSLYATCLNTLYAPKNAKGLEILAEIFEKNRIFCKDLLIIGSDLTVEQCRLLLQILKPTKVEMDSQDSDQFKALFPPNTPKMISIDIDEVDAPHAVAKLLPACQQLHMQTRSQNSKKLYLLRIILQIMQSKQKATLCDFRFSMRWKKWKLPLKEKVEKELYDLNMKIVHIDEGQIVLNATQQHPFCEVTIKGGSSRSCGGIIHCPKPDRGSLLCNTLGNKLSE